MSLPNTYRQLEYLYNPAAAGSGVAYIETGVSGSSVVGYEIGIKVTTVSRSYARYFGGNDLPEYAVLCYNGSSTGSQRLVLHTASTSYNAFYCGND